jgi:NAD(P)H dehydrogenase (quinone)
MENVMVTEGRLSRPVVLILGATGLTGRFLIGEFDRDPGDVHIRVAARRAHQVQKFQSEGRDAVLLDLDDPQTFGPALLGVDRVFLLTGYTVAMLTQSKTFVDAAYKARVQHIVHFGIFGNWDTTDSHFSWHQLVERYIEASGIAWTHLHPNVFMELLPQFMPIRNSTFPVFWGQSRVGWIASRDIADVAATVLRQGPLKHGGQHYWLSAEVASGPEIASMLSEVLGRTIHCDVKPPSEFATTVSATGDYTVEPWYAAGTADFLLQVFDGRMGYIGTVRNDAPYLTGNPPTTLRQWAIANRDRLLQKDVVVTGDSQSVPDKLQPD